MVPDGTPEPTYARDPELYYHPTTWPGARLPHVWVEHQGKRVSTLDLCGHGRFTLLTGIGGEGWIAAAKEVGARFGLQINALTIGPSGCDALDIYTDWYRSCEIEEDGCILVRPDHHVAWRAPVASAAAMADLEAVLTSVLAR